MSIQFTILGLDQIGVSFGLALAQQKDHITRIGYDPIAKRKSKIDSTGAFDKVVNLLSEAVQNADVVLLSLPSDQIESILKDMAADLKEGVVVINTNRICSLAAEWAAQLLPPEARFISMVPSFNGIYLEEKSNEKFAAHADLFKGGEMVIPTNANTHPGAVKIASELTEIVGAHPMFTDFIEAEGLLAKAQVLPKLLSSAFLLTTMQQAGWNDTKKLASSAYRMSADAILHFDETAHPSQGLIANRDHIVSLLDRLIHDLEKIRDLVMEQKNEQLDELILGLQEDHQEWIGQRTSGDWEKKSDDQKIPGVWRSWLGNPGKLLKK